MPSDPNTQMTTRAPAQLTPQQSFGRTVQGLAERGLVEMFGSENGKQAAARVAVAFRAAAASAKDPSALYKCSPESVASCMALSAMTQVMPGGAYPGCYLIPKGGALGWWISARGVKTLARRNGQVVATFPYFNFDDVEIDEFEMTFRLTKGDGDRDDYKSLDGIVVLVRDLSTSAKLGMRVVTKAQIEKRRRKSLQPNGGPWAEWPMEMADKTAIKLAAARGDIVFDEVGATTMMHDADRVVDVTPGTVEPTPSRGHAALGLPAPVEAAPPPVDDPVDEEDSAPE